LIFAGRADELADGRARRVPGDPDIAVYRVGDEFFASADSCSHEEWSLGDDGELDGYEVTCTLHMARFDVRDGKALCLPALRPIKTFPVSVIDGELFVDVAPTDVEPLAVEAAASP
jgi:3-phenylpropionate/trans-cinnamate dioxygenase ferredoxin subunit